MVKLYIYFCLFTKNYVSDNDLKTRTWTPGHSVLYVTQFYITFYQWTQPGFIYIHHLYLCMSKTSTIMKPSELWPSYQRGITAWCVIPVLHIMFQDLEIQKFPAIETCPKLYNPLYILSWCSYSRYKQGDVDRPI